MTDPEPLIDCIDPIRWAAEFKTVLSDNPALIDDDGWLICWFGNALHTGRRSATFDGDLHAGCVVALEDQ